ncbi:MAG: hypothetical protein WC866_00390 [Patescibacteria group bacterium]|jgi:hypothetical protein
MDPVFDLFVVVMIAAAALVGVHANAMRPPGTVSNVRRTSWTLLLGECRGNDNPPAYNCPRVADFREGRLQCSHCRHDFSDIKLPRMSEVSVDGRAGLVRDPNGPLVSSLCEQEEGVLTERHAPVFDFDYPVELREDKILLLRMRAEAPHVSAVLEIMEKHGLAARGSHAAFEARTLDHTVLGDDEGGISPHRVSAFTPSGLEILLSTSGRLVASSTEGHFHLYLDKMLSWEAYREVLCRMADAGLIERNWFRLCDQRKMGMLRKPEFKKPGAFTPPHPVQTVVPAAMQFAPTPLADDPDEYWNGRTRDAGHASDSYLALSGRKRTSDPDY